VAFHIGREARGVFCDKTLKHLLQCCRVKRHQFSAEFTFLHKLNSCHTHERRSLKKKIKFVKFIFLRNVRKVFFLCFVAFFKKKKIYILVRERESVYVNVSLCRSALSFENIDKSLKYASLSFTIMFVSSHFLPSRSHMLTHYTDAHSHSLSLTHTHTHTHTACNRTLSLSIPFQKVFVSLAEERLVSVCCSARLTPLSVCLSVLPTRQSYMSDHMVPMARVFMFVFCIVTMI